MASGPAQREDARSILEDGSWNLMDLVNWEI
jgi:hypothetical protein